MVIIFVPSAQELDTGLWANELACRPLSRKDGRGCEWWLRDRGNDNRYAAVVGVGGGIGEFGRMMSAVPKVNVRPAMWIRR